MIAAQVLANEMAVDVAVGVERGSAVFSGGDSHYSTEWASWKAIGGDAALGVELSRHWRFGGLLGFQYLIYDGAPWSLAQHPHQADVRLGPFVALAFGERESVQHGPQLAVGVTFGTQSAHATEYDAGGAGHSNGSFFELGYDVAIHLDGPLSLLLQPHLRAVNKGQSHLSKSRDQVAIELGGFVGARFTL